MNGQFEVVIVKLIAVLVQKYVVVCKKKIGFFLTKILQLQLYSANLVYFASFCILQNKCKPVNFLILS